MTTTCRSGELNPKRAEALGVRPGRAFAQLKAGQAVVTQDGRTVASSEVTASAHVGSSAARAVMQSFQE